MIGFTKTESSDNDLYWAYIHLIGEDNGYLAHHAASFINSYHIARWSRPWVIRLCMHMSHFLWSVLVTTAFTSEYPVWTSGRPSNGMYKISVEMKYPDQAVTYHTGFWQMFKYAIVQYIAILLVFAFICERVKLFVFSHQLINTVAIKPFKNS